MITDIQAQRIASDWHGGGGSPLYAFASTGAITDGLAAEIRQTIFHEKDCGEHQRLAALLHYVRTSGERAPIADWYARVICAS